MDNYKLMNIIGGSGLAVLGWLAREAADFLLGVYDGMNE